VKDEDVRKQRKQSQMQIWQISEPKAMAMNTEEVSWSVRVGSSETRKTRNQNEHDRWCAASSRSVFAPLNLLTVSLRATKFTRDSTETERHSETFRKNFRRVSYVFVLDVKFEYCVRIDILKLVFEKGSHTERTDTSFFQLIGTAF
jgi:hypothetical protein